MNENKCIICNQSTYHLKTVLNYHIVKCGWCGLEYVNPMPLKKELNDFYIAYNDIRASDAVLKLNATRNIELLSKYGLSIKSKLMDFGCGKNIFMECGKSKNWCGYDPYQKNQMEMVVQFIDFDFITMWGVLEHLIDPVGELNDIVSILKMGGKIVLTTVTTESNIPYQHKPPEHVTYWTKKSIKKLFDLVGLELIEYSSYQMIQKTDIYLQILLRTVPVEYQDKIYHKLPEYLKIPTNEIFLIGEKKQ